MSSLKSCGFHLGLLWWLRDKESACNAGDAGSIPGSEKSLEKEMATHSSILDWKNPWTDTQLDEGPETP